MSALATSPSPPDARTHVVQLYRDGDEIAAPVAAFLAEGLEAGRPAVAIATEEHRTLVADRLRTHGWDPAELAERGLLHLADADATLARILAGGVPDPERFGDVIGRLLERMSDGTGGAPVQVYGEMVDVLWRRGDPDGAVALEELWNDLDVACDFSLLCGYRIDIFDRTAQVAFLPQVCRVHSHVVPGADAERVERAVDAALTETLGRFDAEKIYGLVRGQEREQEVPLPQLALMWLSAHMPGTAERVLAAARAHYGAPVPA